VASAEEIRLGRLAVKRGVCTDEQVIALLRARNQDPSGPDLGVLLLQKGALTPQLLAELQRQVAQGEGAPATSRHERSTDHEISVSSAREAIARECLDEAVVFLREKGKRDEALKELRRLADEFADTESGNRARAILDEVGRGA